MNKVSELKNLAIVMNAVLGGTVQSPAKVVTAWLNRDKNRWPQDLELYVKLSNYFINIGEIRVALDVANIGAAYLENSHFFQLEKDENPDVDLIKFGVRILQLKAIAKVRLGIISNFQDQFEQLDSLILKLDKSDAELLSEENTGIMAKQYKMLYEADPDKREYLQKSYEHYRHASGADRKDVPLNIWTGINAATLAYFLGKNAIAIELAKEIDIICDRIIKEATESSDIYWHLATKAEAALLLELTSENALPGKVSQDMYITASRAANGRWSDLQSTRKQLQLILKHYCNTEAAKTAVFTKEVSKQWVKDALWVPPVIIFSGHMLDSADETCPRFPADKEEAAKESIKDMILKLCKGQKPHYGYASLANGADILFHEALNELGGQSHIVFPFNADDFAKESVAIGKDDNTKKKWKKRFDAIRQSAAEELYASSQKLEYESIAYVYANQYLLGLAGIRAKTLDMELKGLALWDGKIGKGAGGTADNVALWIKSKVSVDVIDVKSVGVNKYSQISQNTIKPVSFNYDYKESAQDKSGLSSHICGLLFADVKHFSRLTEKQIPIYADKFIGAIHTLSNKDEFKDDILFSNTWGDAFYFVFKTVEKTALFALAMSQAVKELKREETGLPENLDIRVAVHAGPVFQQHDKILNRDNFFGYHVSYAARLEPVTRPGAVFATDAFVAVINIKDIKSVNFEYVGRVKLPKDFGICETFKLIKTD